MPVNKTMVMDYYELTMANGYFNSKMKDKIGYFDLFFRKVPDNGGFAIACGLEQIVKYVNELEFSKEDIDFLRTKNMFSEGFLDYLANFEFTGDIYAVPEGTVVFPNEPIITVKAPIIQAQIIETYLLLSINHQSLIATKANRIVRSANGKAVMEFGTRRAQGANGAVLGARASYIGGVGSSACVACDQLYGVPSIGTMAHSWVQMFDTEYEAFKEYAEQYPTNATLLVDTYNVVKSGVPNAIKVFDEVLKPMGITNCGIRIDSGDIAYLSIKARKMLDEAGWSSCRIVASNSLDEKLIRDLGTQGAKLDAFGVGERLITAKSDPVFGGVYKLCAVEDETGEITPKIKVSENTVKITTPHYKKLYRFYQKETNQAIADLLTVYDEAPDFTKPYTIFDPNSTWKKKEITDYYVVELLKPIFLNGKQVYNLPTTSEIKAYCEEQVEGLWDEVKRFENPHAYYVDLSQKLWDIKNDLLAQSRDL